MQFKIPLLYSDLTLGQLITINTEDDPFKRVSACANITIEQLRKQPKKVVSEADDHLKKIVEMETGKHHKIIDLDGEEYGFIPDWSEFTLGEWIDLEEYTKDFWGNALKIASILYRPIDRRQGKAYTIKPYTAKEETEVFSQLSAELFGGMLLFFSTSRRKLLHTLKSSLVEGVASQMNSLSDGVGIQPSTPLQESNSSKWMKSLSSLFGSYSRISLSSKTSTSK